MKRFLLIGLLVLIGFSVIAPTPSYAWGRGGWGAGWFVGGLALGTAIGVSARPYYYYPPPAYAYPQPPAYAYPAPSTYPPSYGYTQPAPAPVSPQPSAGAYASPGQAPAKSAQNGEWVTVPGQSINGRWVPEHKAWVPTSP